MPHSSALVTGSSKRIGREIAIHLAQIGYHVALHCHHSTDDALALSQQLTVLHPQQMFPVVCHNLEHWEMAGTIFSQLPPEMPHVQLLVNNASLFEPGTLSHTPPEQLLRNHAINFFAPLELMRAFEKQTPQGHIINILDTQICRNTSTHAAYLLAKKSLMHLTQMAALEWAPRIRVNAIAPGPVLPATDGLPNRFESVVKQSPMQQAVSIETLLNGINFLNSAPQITGQIIYADSGSHL